jgi:hypothetical protein
MVGFLREEYLRISSLDMQYRLRLGGGILKRGIFDNQQFGYAVQTANVVGFLQTKFNKTIKCLSEDDFRP